MKKILILSSLALVLTACSNDTGSKSKPVISKATTEQSMETTKAEEKTTATEETRKEERVSLSAYAGLYQHISKSQTLLIDSNNRISSPYGEIFSSENKKEGNRIILSTKGTVKGEQVTYEIEESSPNQVHIIYPNASRETFKQVRSDAGKMGEINESKKDKKESASNTNSSLTEAQAEALAKGMKTFGEKMGQVPYEKTDVPGKLTWQSGGDLEGYKVYESYIYKSGGTTHRYFFVTNSSGTPEVLYSTGGTSVKNTANADIVVMFKGVYGGGSSDREEKNEIKSTTSANTNSYTGVYRAKNGDEVILQEDGTLKVSKLNRTLVSRSNSNGSISFAPTNDYNSPANVSMYHLIPANQPVSDKMYRDIDDSSKDRIIFSMPGGMPESAREIYFKVGDAPEKKEENFSSKSSKSKLDIDAISKGDLSSINGSYEGTMGGTWEIIGNIVKYKGMPETMKNPIKVEGAVRLTFERGGYLVVVPAGVRTPSQYDGPAFGKDSSRDRVIVIGEGVNFFYLN